MVEILKMVMVFGIVIVLCVFAVSSGLVKDYETNQKLNVCIKGIFISLLSVGIFIAGLSIPESIEFNIIYHFDDKSPISYLITDKESGESFSNEIIAGQRVWVPYDEYKVQVDTEIRDASPVVFETSTEDAEFEGTVIALFTAIVEMNVLDNPGIFLIAAGIIGMLAGVAYILITLDKIQFIKAGLDAMFGSNITGLNNK